MLIKGKCMLNLKTKNNSSLADHLYHCFPISAPTGRTWKTAVNRCQYCGNVYTKGKSLVNIEVKDV